MTVRPSFLYDHCNDAPYYSALSQSTIDTCTRILDRSHKASRAAVELRFLLLDNPQLTEAAKKIIAANIRRTEVIAADDYNWVMRNNRPYGPWPKYVK